MVRPGQLGLHRQAGDQEVAPLGTQHRGIMTTAVQHLHVVDADDGLPVHAGVDVGPGLEVADDDVGREAGLGDAPVHADVVQQPLRRALEVLAQALEEVEAAAVFELERQAGDLLHRRARERAQPLAQQRVGATRHHHPHLVARAEEVLEQHQAAGRVPHPLADHAVEDSHAPRVAPVPAGCHPV